MKSVLCRAWDSSMCRPLDHIITVRKERKINRRFIRALTSVLFINSHVASCGFLHLSPDMDPLFLILCCLILYYRHLQSQETNPKWESANIHHFHDCATALLADAGYSLESKEILGQRYFATCDPANVRHVFTSNFNNYPKGHEYAEIFDVLLGAGIMNSDGESWRRQRAKAQMLMTAPRFRAFTAQCSRDKVEKSLPPFLALAADEGRPCDLQDVFLRLSFDLTCTLVFGVDTGCLHGHWAAGGSLHARHGRYVGDDFPPPRHPHGVLETDEKAKCWAREEDGRTIDSFIAEMVARARRRADDKSNEGAADLFSSFLCHDNTSDDGESTDEFIRDTTVNLLFAGRDGPATGLSWLFYLVSKNPRVEQKLLEELSALVATLRDGAGSAVDTSGGGSMVTFGRSEVNSLVYLHAALCEPLRLYPPVPFEHKVAAAADVLLSGKELKAGAKILFLNYSMGRMEGVWGKDCTEFWQERWVTKEGKLRHEPSYKFFSFNTRPRTCLGKELAFVQMKTAAAAVLWNFVVEVVPGHVVKPKLSPILHMKNGLIVRVHRRFHGPQVEASDDSPRKK
ncbi:hypothetical protein U9M48_030195 [Paspalum notatum var. saurae]|uniref:Cytochrome P450 n=1 Tax=Paspalum notatum var. saurae TaxID=547442 RepID=A0AAQ3U2I1_PASNO